MRFSTKIKCKHFIEIDPLKKANGSTLALEEMVYIDPYLKIQTVQLNESVR